MENPLLTKRHDFPFADVAAAHVEPAVKELLDDAKNRLPGVIHPLGERTFENTLDAFDHLTDRLDFAMSVVGHLESVVTTPELRAAYNAVVGPVSTFDTELLLDPDLW